MCEHECAEDTAPDAGEYHEGCVTRSTTGVTDLPKRMISSERKPNQDGFILCLFDDEFRLIDIFHPDAEQNAKRAAESEAVSRGIDHDDLEWKSNTSTPWGERSRLYRKSYGATLFMIERREIIS